MSASDGTTPRGSRLARRMVVASRRANLFRWLEIGAGVALAIMIVATWTAFAKTPDETQLLPTRQTSMLLVGTLIPAMALLVLLGRRLALRRAAGSTARMHVRLVFVFSIIAAVPTLLVATFAAILFQSGVDFWFSDSSRGLMDSANNLARGYYEQNQVDVSQETRAMAGDMLYLLRERAADDLANRDFLEDYNYQMQRREINESAILQAFPDGTVNTAVAIGLVEGNQPALAGEKALKKFADGAIEVVQANSMRVEAIIPIDREAGIYLYNARNNESLSFSQWEKATDVVARYQQLTERARALQLRFNLALFFVSLALVGFAVWFALRFADRQVEPLTNLVLAAGKVGAGNFALRIEGRTGADEIGLLNRAFNRMTAQLEAQTDDLMRANRELDERRAFIEAVLESMTAGIVSIDEDGTIQLMNTSARALLFDDASQDGRGRGFAEISPQIAGVMEQGGDRGIVTLNRGADLLTLAVRIAPATGGKVITFEDITRQLLDQRRAAWSDVARRIAHEIKNPLTPIQLATERLKRRYRTKVGDDAALFDELTSTIVRQVGALRKMVDEFSSFARLPKPVFRDENALDLVRQAVFLQEVAHQDIAFTFDTPEDEVPLSCDRHQFGQAMTNVLKNAVEAVEARAAEEREDFAGKIAVAIAPGEDFVDICVTDNGVGLPADRDRIAEPYVTTREKGTGLGLAIVTKIVEEHGGEMSFAPAPDGGTQVILRFARTPEEPASEETPA
ncbi:MULTISPECIES: ATP-binding protein [unclassified Citromicrobium]|uniref:sensor histidine kinase n=1 Tax=unclassified Citromicrobium TaxID=2630544 RepID=UPI0006C93187|nr:MULTISPECIES: ATP-binding protein [unclassified Citromicrobium]OAM09604.1 PAS domain-containing sensor histidine kinase [Citromicrobium sp. RCC1897]